MTKFIQSSMQMISANISAIKISKLNKMKILTGGKWISMYFLKTNFSK